MKIIDLLNKKENREELPRHIKVINNENKNSLEFQLNKNNEYIGCEDFNGDPILLSEFLIDDLLLDELFDLNDKTDFLNLEVEVLKSE